MYSIILIYYQQNIKMCKIKIKKTFSLAIFALEKKGDKTTKQEETELVLA